MSVAVEAAAAVRRRWVAKAGKALEIATGLLDPGVDILDERSRRYDERLELMARVIDAAARATLHEKIKALGHVLADGLNDDDHIDEALVLWPPGWRCWKPCTSPSSTDSMFNRSRPLS